MSEENRTNAPEEELTQEDINSLKKIRMDKLEELKAKGKNPFEITKYDVRQAVPRLKHNMKSLRLSLRSRQAKTRKSSRSFSRQTA